MFSFCIGFIGLTMQSSVMSNRDPITSTLWYMSLQKRKDYLIQRRNLWKRDYKCI